MDELLCTKQRKMFPAKNNKARTVFEIYRIPSKRGAIPPAYTPLIPLRQELKSGIVKPGLLP